MPLYSFSENTVKVVFHNVNSLLPHLADIQSDFSTMAADICFFIDTRLKNEDKISFPGLAVKDHICMENQLRVPGGLMLTSKNSLKIHILKKINEVKKNYFANLLLCKFEDYSIAGVYFSPKCPTLRINKLLQECLESVPDME